MTFAEIVTPQDQYEIAKARAEIARACNIGTLAVRRFKDLIRLRFTTVDWR